MNRYIIITKRALLIAVAIVLSLTFAIIIFTMKDIIIPTAVTEKKLPIYSTQRTDKKIAISFDAAWGADDTHQLIETLNQFHVKTTFFVVGEWVDKYPDMVKALHDAGHEIQNHSNTHPHLTNLSENEISQEIENCNKKIQEITGTRPTLMRPPYGDYNNKVIEATQALGMHTIQWSVDSLDWKNLTAEQITDRVISAIEPGGIVLFHNAAKHTPQALPIILETLQKQGYEIVPISELIYTKDYTIDHTGKQIPNN